MIIEVISSGTKCFVSGQSVALDNGVSAVYPDYIETSHHILDFLLHFLNLVSSSSRRSIGSEFLY